MASTSIRRIRGGGNLVVPWQALLAPLCPWESDQGAFFSAQGAGEGVEQAAITQGGTYGQDGQRSRAHRGIGTADESDGSPYPHRRTAAARVVGYCLWLFDPGPHEPITPLGHGTRGSRNADTQE